ncbi:PilT/PilU family type 4a pilus ATPase [Algiphilus sp.]|uniref:PilT/PilU family type 4a pilus ATPase n=1 Tax=Algiphilus sp. TaxID=1872431 RepID=UPI003B51944D
MSATPEALRGFQQLLPYLRLATQKRASDLYFTAGSPAMLRIEGQMHAVGGETLKAEAVEAMADSILSEHQREELTRRRSVDLATHAGGHGRFRANVFFQRGEIAMVMRFVGADVPTLEGLRLPEVLSDLSMLRRGLLLVVGATGSGKSTTLAAMLNHRNATAQGHILTIEDPIEFVHPHRRCVINQREVGIDVPDYDTGLVSAMREAPDVVLIGEVRQYSTMRACLHMANTGHFALSTLHANNAYQALQRIAAMYPSDQREQLYMDLGMTLRAVVSQRLVVGKDGRRLAACEVLLNTPYVSELITAGRIHEIRDAIESSRDRGMQSFDHALATLYREGQITEKEALEHADSRANLEAKLHFGGR